MDPSDDKNIDYQKGTISTVDLHDAIRREDPLQPGGRGGVSMLVLVLASVILIFGGGHLFSSLTVARYYSPTPRPVADAGADAAAQLSWIDKWMADGKKQYVNCQTCHQPTGLGQPGLFPPLKGSEWVDGGTKRLGAILIHGINGPFKVAGQNYNQLMPAWNTLSDEKIAQVLTYVRRTFGTMPEGQDGVVTAEMIKAAREEFKNRTGPFTEAELLAIPADAELSGVKVNLETGEPL